MKLMRDDNIYIKNESGEYVPYGVRYNENYLPDGIWFVRHREYSYQTTNVDKHLTGIYKKLTPTNITLEDMCGMEDIIDYIIHTKEYDDTINNKTGYSIMDILRVAVVKTLEKCELNKMQNVKSIMDLNDAFNK